MQLKAELCHEHMLQRPGLFGTAKLVQVCKTCMWGSIFHLLYARHIYERLEFDLLQRIYFVPVTRCTVANLLGQRGA